MHDTCSHLLSPSKPRLLTTTTVTVRKGGRVSIVGVYLGYMNQLNFGCYMGENFPLTAFHMCRWADNSPKTHTHHQTHTISPAEKGLTMKAGQTPVQKYWQMLLEKVQNKVRTHARTVPKIKEVRSMCNSVVSPFLTPTHA